MEEITLTEEELQKRIDDAVSKKTEEIKAENDEKFASYRKKRDEQEQKAVAKAVEDAKLSTEDLEKKKHEEENKQKEEELAELRAFKKSAILEAKLTEKGLPSFFKNDSRLLNSKDEEIDDVITTIESEYRAVVPKTQGATINTNLGGGKEKTPEETQLEYNRNLGLGK